MTKLGLVMDPIDSINILKDSTFAMALAAQNRGWNLTYMEMGDLYLRDGKAFANARELTVRDDPQDWFSLSDSRDMELSELDVVLMRKDPPIDTEYLYATQILALAETQGTLMVNRTQSLREANEKLACAWFPQCAPPTLVSRDQARLRQFLTEHNDLIIKPLHFSRARRRP
jgi:glutathione synthase